MNNLKLISGISEIEDNAAEKLVGGAKFALTFVGQNGTKTRDVIDADGFDGAFPEGTRRIGIKNLDGGTSAYEVSFTGGKTEGGITEYKIGRNKSRRLDYRPNQVIPGSNGFRDELITGVKINPQ